MEFQKPYAGTLQYIPRLTLPDDALSRLRRKLREALLVEQPENPQVMLDWSAVERDANRTPVRQSQVALLRDGGDGETPACIFYRKDTDRKANTTQEFYHLPPQAEQEALALAWPWWDDLAGGKLAALNAYFDRIAGVSDAWQPL